MNTPKQMVHDFDVMQHKFRIILPRRYIRIQSRQRDDDSNNRWHNTTKNNNGKSQQIRRVNRLFIDLPGIRFAIYTIQAWQVVVYAIHVLVIQYRWIFQFVLYWLAQHAAKSLWTTLSQRQTGSDTVQKPVIFNEVMNVYKCLGEFEKYLEDTRITDQNDKSRQLLNFKDTEAKYLLERA